MTQRPLSVAVPWSLSHYIPLNGFHPLYQSLFDHRPDNITMSAWDNTELSNALRGDGRFRKELLAHVMQEQNRYKSEFESLLALKYTDAFFVPNIALTSLLPGDIEFHHTAPFPSMIRPFIFHCESFAPIFFPFMQQGSGNIDNAEALREHYGKIFSNPLCLGIFSHIPHTLEEIKKFFGSPDINAKLYPSRIGLTPRVSKLSDDVKVRQLRAPRFLFINSANQNPKNFIHRGGHIILRFWFKFNARFPGAKLYLRCRRPTDEILSELGVDLTHLRREESQSIIWIQDFIGSNELDRLMFHVHFFLLPSASLHSVSIMQAMANGAVPVVSDTVGTNQYVTHGHDGIVLNGVHANNWKADADTNILIDRFHRNLDLEDSLVQQIEENIIRLIDVPQEFNAIRLRAMVSAGTKFSGEEFSQDFWNQVRSLWDRYGCQKYQYDNAYKLIPPLEHCLVDTADWPRIFESVPQPMTRIYTGRGRVTELAGAFVYSAGNAKVGLHDWCVAAEYYKSGAPALRYVNDISELGGKYLTESRVLASHSFATYLSVLLFPYPRLHRFVARLHKKFRKFMNSYGIRNEEGHIDIQLVAQNISGMNVVRAQDHYYAIPQDGGAFSEEKANSGGYRLCFKASTLRRVLGKIMEYEAAQGPISPQSIVGEDAPILVEEGFSGFNIIRYADKFFAVPQGEGTFEHQRALAGGYSHVHVGITLDDTKHAISSYAR